ncbi:unnamed protein product, partial [Chrysoparadoxa australica]
VDYRQDIEERRAMSQEEDELLAQQKAFHARGMKPSTRVVRVGKAEGKPPPPEPVQPPQGPAEALNSLLGDVVEREPQPNQKDLKDFKLSGMLASHRWQSHHSIARLSTR